jgi:hypothetical protein
MEDCPIAFRDPGIEGLGRWHAGDANPAMQMDRGRGLTSLQELMQRIRHQTISEQVSEINAVLRRHYAYYGLAGNLRSLVKVCRVVERYWRKMLCSRSWAGRRLTSVHGSKTPEHWWILSK